MSLHRNSWAASAALLSLVLVACAAGPALHLEDPTPQQAVLEWERIRPERPWATLEGLREGRHLYIQRCGSCHALPDPASLDRNGWNLAMARMAPKAHLDSLQTRQILDWLATRTPATPGK